MLNRVAAASCLATLLLLAPLVQSAQARKSKKTQCANTLRQLALGAVQYTGDKRFFPHVGSLRELDGDVRSNHTPKVMRALLWFGYVDQPEGFVCPSSYDKPATEEFPDNRRAWTWGGRLSSEPNTHPFAEKGTPALNATTELSYGWSRRGMNRSVRSTAPLGADRAVDQKGAENTPLAGNHADGWNVAYPDATVQFHALKSEPFPGLWLVAVEKLQGLEANPGSLALKPQIDASLFDGAFSKPRERPGPLEPPKPRPRAKGK